jgi:CRISPR-associated protein Cas2
MWVFAMFDLPTDTKKARKAYTRFRKGLIKDGFVMMQYSVYVRHCASEDNARVHTERVIDMLPSQGEVRVIELTDKQFERMRVFIGKEREPTEKPSVQLEFL